MAKTSRIPISLTEVNRRRDLAERGIDYKKYDRILRERNKGIDALRGLLR